MKHNRFRMGLLALTLLLILSLCLLTGCAKSSDNSAGTSADGTADETAGDTTSDLPDETLPTDLSAADLLDKLWAEMDMGNTDESATVENMKMDVDMTIGMDMSMGGMENSTSLPVKMTIVVDGENIVCKGDLMGAAFDMTYVDGTLYLSADGENYKCAVTPEEYAELMGGVMGDMGGSGDDLIPDVELPEDLKPSEIFATVTSEADLATGTITLTAKGFNQKMSETFAPLLKPMLEAFGLVGGELDENGELISDPATVLAEVVKILHDLNEDTLSMSFVIDREGNLSSVGIKLIVGMEQTMDGEVYKTTLNLEGGFSVKMGGQTVAAPSGEYVEEDWRVIFGQETAEMLDLIPDAEGHITLADDPDLRGRQLNYISLHAEEFPKNITFTMTAILVAGETYEDGSMDVYMYPAADPENIDGLLVGTIRSSIDHMPGEEPLVAAVQGYFDMEEYDGFVYNSFVVQKITPSAVSVAA